MPASIVFRESMPSLHIRTDGMLSRVASMKSFMSRSFANPAQWRLGSARSRVDSPLDWYESTDQQVVQLPSEQPIKPIAVVNRGKLLVVAILYVTCEDEEASFISRFRRSQPRRLVCTVHHNGDVKTSSQAVEPGASKRCTFNEKFVFKSSDKASTSGNALKIVVSRASRNGASTSKQQSGEVDIDMDGEASRMAAAWSRGPVHKCSRLSGAIKGTVHYVVHRIPVNTSAAESAAKMLSRSSSSLNDDDDMATYGRTFPELWYLIPDGY